MNYSTLPQPTAAQVNTEEWKNSASLKRFWLEGNSNVQGMNVAQCIHPDAWNLGQGGDVPQGCINQFINELKPKIDAGILNKPEKVYIQIGANYYRAMPCAEFFWGSYTSLLEQMSTLIDLYKGVVANPSDIVVSSMPWVRPDMTILEIPSWITAEFGIVEYYTRLYWASYIAQFPWNNYLAVASNAVEILCKQKGVQYLNVFVPLMMIWKANYSSFWWWSTQTRWWDSVHYDSVAHMYLGNLIRESWGI